ncbi:glucose-1-phosphate thymidylyltransferase RfbA [methanogenic archaeon ISO4-H5]|nr:glucose-1-phosphate thymidylyltransferase RfbA [methanogenic archaeon ISO4-H5]
MKGIILAAGKGTRLYPASKHISKILLPVYDKPMIYYPLTTLMSAGIRDIMIIVSKEDKAYFKKLLGDGKQFGISIKYAIQKTQKGIADALLVGEKFIDGDMVALVLGDNVFHGEEMYEHLAQAMAESDGATVFCKQVEDPRAFGVAEIDNEGKVLSLEEKPSNPKSDWAVTGLYVYDKNACKLAKTLSPSARGELEITDLNKRYMEKGLLKTQLLEEGVIWADTGTFESLLDASIVIHTIEKTGREMVGCPEEVALQRGFITKRQLSEWIAKSSGNSYYDYLNVLLQKE